MSFSISRTYTIQAAHHLPHVPEGHKCGRLHGHTYSVEVEVSAPLRDDGFVIDFAEIDAAWRIVHDTLDHRCLNDIAQLENPTSEILAEWIWGVLSVSLPLSAIRIRENAHSCVIFTGR